MSSAAVSNSTTSTSVTCLLVANRGEIARRICRTAQQMGIRTVAVYVDADTDAPHVHDADDAVLLAGGSYLDGASIIAAARAAGADAIHPGYGFLSENAAFATAVMEAGITWVGPPPSAMSAMGDKLAAKRLAVEAGVPVLPGADDPADADSVGYPLLVKAAAGGGGKGMRVVERPEDLADAVIGARREALGGFGDETVFIERYVARSRHVEIQVLGDAHGNVLHLGERECSIQRRHQKIIEESPSPVVDPAMRAAMGASAVALAKQLGYRSAGTVEFLVDDAVGADGTRAYWFLEVNTRLQVEHPVTEMVTGLDLVREQIRIARGERLGYTQDDVRFQGHAIEVRLYAEDPAAGFLPATGTLHAYEPAATPVVRWDSGVERGSVIGTSFDPTLAKVISHAGTRSEAATRLALALERTHLAGITTNRDLLVATLRHPGFLAGDTTTDFLERVGPARTRPLDDATVHRAAVAVALWMQGRNRAEAATLPFMRSGWRNARLPDQRVEFRSGDRSLAIGYHSVRDGSFVVDGSIVTRVRSWTPAGDGTPGTIDVEVGGRRVSARITQFGDRVVVHDGAGDIELQLVPRFVVPGLAAPTGGLTAPMPGKVLEVRVQLGDQVAAGAVLVVLEAMKMEHRITSPWDGMVSGVHVSVGDQVELGAPLLLVEEAEE